MQSARFDVCWESRCSHGPQRRDARWTLGAVLLERTLLAGKPAHRLAARIAAIDEDRLADPVAREEFWHAARTKLGKLRRLSSRDIDAIEALLAMKVPKPVPQQAAG